MIEILEAERNLSYVKRAISANHNSILYDFLYKFREIAPASGRHLAVGHGKPKQMKFMKSIARQYSDSELVYYDQNQTFIGGMLVNPFRTFFGRRAGILPKNVSLSSNPLGYFNSASCFFAMHEFPSEEERLEMLEDVYKRLSEGAILAAVDYDLKWVEKVDDPGNCMRRIFNNDNEIRVMEDEADWIEAHTRFGLADCIKECEEAGFQTVFSDVRDKKLFLYLGRKN